MTKIKNTKNNPIEEKFRLDKWLWAARFYKTRSLATEAIKGGKVHLNGQRFKPSRMAEVGDHLKIRKDHIERTIVVVKLSAKRGSATIAQALYEETNESIELREKQSLQRKTLFAGMPQHTLRRPNKKDRRKIIQFKQDHNE